MRGSGGIAIIGNALPRQCGIAAFTTDLRNAVSELNPERDVQVIAMIDRWDDHTYPPSVTDTIREDEVDDYIRAADKLNTSDIDFVILQHEFGIYGGESGEHVLVLMKRLRVPVVTTLHTILTDPNPSQRRVFDEVCRASTRLVVMSETGKRLLQSVYGVAPGKIDVIPHGIPDRPMLDPDTFKDRHDCRDRKVILTFGLLSPNKGVEHVIDAMPRVLEHCPDAVYIVLGATHPNLVRANGEAYRDALSERARELGVADHVVFVNRFADQDTMFDYVSMCDVYVTPYLEMAQITSGTLAQSFGLGKAVISTPYWHAQELLADDHGVLVPPADPQAIADAIIGLLCDDARRDAMRLRAYRSSRGMVWARVAQRYVDVADKLALMPRRPAGGSWWRIVSRLPELQLGYFHTMCDDTGMYQHAVAGVPDRAHGYCIDDNARALLLACTLMGQSKSGLSETLVSRFAAFMQHAWNPDIGRFRNFMSFDRRWLEDQGSQDSHGRALWALGICARSDTTPARRLWAERLFAQALPATEHFESPRALAFTLLGLAGYCEVVPTDRHARSLRDRFARKLLDRLKTTATPDWPWFEDGLSYDNARLCQALIETGSATDNAGMVEAGLASLRWLTAIQSAPAGHFRPVGSESFGDLRKPPRPCDQQPVEAAATISACLAAHEVEGNLRWIDEALRAFAWFIGHNDLATSLVDADGSCRDGLGPAHLNENRGAESVLAYLTGLTEIHRATETVVRSGSDTRPTPLVSAVVSAKR